MNDWCFPEELYNLITQSKIEYKTNAPRMQNYYNHYTACFNNHYSQFFAKIPEILIKLWSHEKFNTEKFSRQKVSSSKSFVGK